MNWTICLIIMPHHCAVPGCTANSSTSPQLSFHSFPSAVELKKQWLAKIRRDEAPGIFVASASARVCSRHFLETDYCSGGRKRARQTDRELRRLSSGAVPSQFECFPEHLQPKAAKRKEPTERLPLESKAKKRCFSVAATSSDADSSDTSDVSVSVCDSHCKCVSSLTERICELEKELELESENRRETRRQLEKCKKECQTTEEKLCREQDKREFCLE